MAVKSTINTGDVFAARKPYPKLVKDNGGNVYFCFNRTQGVSVHLINAQPLTANHFYASNGVDWDAPYYTDFDGAVTLKNT